MKTFSLAEIRRLAKTVPSVGTVSWSLKKKDVANAARHFRVVEIDGLRLALPAPDIYRWMQSTGAQTAEFDGTSIRLTAGASSASFHVFRDEIPAPAQRVARENSLCLGVACRRHVPLAALAICT